MNWPGYNYLGPGNSLDNGTPVNSIDEVAREHDYAYSSSETYSDIVNADKLAIEKFRIEYEKTGKLAAKVGQVGLQVKTTVEKGIGRTLYPWNMPKRGASASTSAAPYGLSKRGRPLNRGQYLYKKRVQKRPSALPPLNLSEGSDEEVVQPEEGGVDTVDQAMDQMQGDEPVAATASSHPGTGGLGLSDGVQYLSNNPPNVQSVTFKRSRYMKSWGNKIKYFSEPENKDKKSPTMYTTSMVWLPVELLKFYINKAEYESLPFNAKVTAVRVKVTPVGSQCCFTTNATNAAWTNSTQTLFGIHSIGLNRTGFVKANKVKSRKAASPMEIESVEVVTPSDWNRLFATENDSVHLPSTFGVIRSLPWYTSVFQPSTEYFSNVGTFDLSKYVTMWEFSGHVKKPIINYEYKTVNGYIKHKKMVHNLVQASKKIHLNIQPTAVCEITGTGDNVDIAKSSSVYLRSREFQSYNETFIDDMFQGMMNETSSMNVLQPSVHFGVLACQANAPDDGLSVPPEFVNVSAIWQIDSEIDIEWDINCVMQRDPNLGMYQQSVHNTGSYKVSNYYNYPSVFGALNYTT